MAVFAKIRCRQAKTARAAKIRDFRIRSAMHNESQ
jgi:hypothetical protein